MIAMMSMLHGDEPKKAKQDKDEMGVDVGLLKKNCNARLTSNKQDKELAKREAMEQMLKNWKEKIPCERCDSLQKELKELKETLNDKEKSISSMKEEIDELNFLQHLHCEPSPKMLPAGHFCCITYPYVDILYYFFLTVPASAQSVRFLRALTDFYDHNSCSPSVNIPLTISSSHGDEHQETQMKGLHFASNCVCMSI